jgi:hypothetical protein
MPAMKHFYKHLYLPYFVLLLFLFTSISCTKESNTLAQKDNGAGGSLNMFTITAGHLYILDGAYLQVYDLKDPAKPIFKVKQKIGHEIETIFPYQGKLFIGAKDGMYIYSLANPAAPEEISTVNHLRSCDPVVTQGNTAYVTLRAGTMCGGLLNALIIYDVSNLKQPMQKFQLSFAHPYGLGVKGKALYICDGTEGLHILDITDPVLPKPVSVIKGETFYDVIPYDNVLICYLEKGIALYDITQPLAPTLLSNIK